MAETKGRYGLTIVLGTLMGADRARLRELGTVEYKTYGALKDYRRAPSVQAPIRFLLLVNAHHHPGAFIPQRGDVPHLQHAVLLLGLVQIGDRFLSAIESFVESHPHSVTTIQAQEDEADGDGDGKHSGRQEPQDDGEPIAALCLRHAVDDLFGLGCHVLLLVFPVAVAAVVAGRDGLFPEIVEDVVAQTPGSPTVPLHDKAPG